MYIRTSQHNLDDHAVVNGVALLEQSQAVRAAVVTEQDHLLQQVAIGVVWELGGGGERGEEGEGGGGEEGGEG